MRRFPVNPTIVIPVNPISTILAALSAEAPMSFNPSQLFPGVAALINSNGGTVEIADLSSAEVIGIYFAARWCGDCNVFTPALAQSYTELKAAGKRYEIVFVSSDFDEHSMRSHHADMPWLCLHWHDLSAIGEELQVTHACHGVPHLVFIDTATGAVMKTRKTPVPPSLFFPAENVDTSRDTLGFPVTPVASTSSYRDALSRRRVPVALHNDGSPLDSTQMCIEFTEQVKFVASAFDCTPDKRAGDKRKKLLYTNYVPATVTRRLLRRLQRGVLSFTCGRLAAVPAGIHLHHSTVLRLERLIQARVVSSYCSRSRVRCSFPA
jgi:nucleoredoxin